MNSKKQKKVKKQKQKIIDKENQPQQYTLPLQSKFEIILDF